VSGKNALKVVGDPSNGAESAISSEQPWAVTVTIEGQSDLLFHRWQTDAVIAKSKAAKNSAAKKSDNLEDYVWRDEDGNLCLPGEYLRASITEAAKFSQDPRSPRKSARDLFRAGIISATNLASLGCREWDYEDRRRALVQRQAITRTRPALRVGWRASVTLIVLTPEYIPATLLREVLDRAGRLVGVGDFRPTFGRFAVVGFEVEP
jgi:hypothetical protein